MAAIYVGIDVSKDRLDIHLRPGGETLSVARTASGIIELTDALATHSVALVVLEATGGYETVVAHGIAAAGLPVAVINPAQIRHFARALGRLAKTDRIDAEVIARFGEATNPTPRPLTDESTILLAEMIARRRQVVAMLVAERQRLGRGGTPRVVGQDLVGLLHGAESGGSVRCCAAVRMVQTRLLAKRLLDVGERGRAADTQGGVVVFQAVPLVRQAG